MQDYYDDFSDYDKNTVVERKRPIFKIQELKIEHFYFFDVDKKNGMPISTSIELVKINDESKWKKIVSHTYVSLENYKENITDRYEESLNENEIIRKIENNDLRDLKNNYYTEDEPECLSHWELTYNNDFKIVGTYDQEIPEFKNISELLELKETIKSETQKVKDELESEQ